MKKILLSLMITLILISPVWANKLDDRQLKESYAKSADVYTKAEADATTEAAIAAIPIPSVSTTITATAGENLTAHDIVKIINDGGAKAYKYLSEITSYGTHSAFYESYPYFVVATALSDTKFVVCYQDYGGADEGEARVGIVDGSNDLTWGTVSTFEESPTSHISVTALSATKFIVCYQDSANSNYGTARVGIVDGSNDLTWGTASVFEEARTNYTSATTLSATKFVVCYQDYNDNSYGTARVGIVDGSNDLTWGTVSTFGYVGQSVSATALSDTKFIVCCDDSLGGAKGEARVGIVDGSNDLTWGTASIFEEASVYYISATTLSATKFIVCYQDSANSNYGTARVGIVDGSNDLTWGTASVFEEAYSNYISATALSDTKFVVCYRDNDNSNYGTARVGTVSVSNNLTWGTVSVFNATTSYFTAATALSGTKFVVCYLSNFGDAVVGDTSSYSGLFIPAFTNSTTTSGSSATFAVLAANSKITNSTLSLSALTQYYLDSNSALTSEVSANYYIGIGLDTTSIFIDGTYPTSTATSTIPVSLQRK